MIELKDISLALDDRAILEHCSAVLPERGVICLFGPSGCGKTTFAKVLTGLQAVDSGCVVGIQRAESAVMFQEHRLFPWLTVQQNVAAVLPKHGDAMYWLRAVGLAEFADLKPTECSGGMQRRAALARALAYGGRLLVLDEPFQGLDTSAKQALYPWIRTASETKPVLLITHDKEEATALSDCIWYVEGPPLHVVKQQRISEA